MKAAQMKAAQMTSANLATRHQLLGGAVLLLALTALLPYSAPVFAALFPQLERPVYAQESFAWLLGQHCLLAGASSAIDRKSVV